MKTLATFALYTLVSGVVGFIICALLLRNPRTRRLTAIAAAICFGGPPVAYGYLWILDTVELSSFKQDVAYVAELCAKDGGDKIYRTAENVEGVFQMRARDSGDSQLRDQFGMFDPWGFAQYDRADPAVPVGYQADDYRFVETQLGANRSGPPFRRKILIDTGRRIGDLIPRALPEQADKTIWERQWFEVSRLRSRYGYITEDLTTSEMRRRWIGAGKIKIIDLATNEVMAQRVGYFRAAGPMALDHWSGGGAYQNGRICPQDSSLSGFLLSVLRPLPPIVPTSDLVQSLYRE
jgi:hypothetical protein